MIQGIQVVEKKFKTTKFDEIPSTQCMQYGLTNVFINIIKNANQAIDGKGKKDDFINISTRQLENNIVIEIEDSGGGIQLHNNQPIEKIFDFKFSTQNTEGDEKGAGIGLFMCKKTIETGHNGRIIVESGYEKQEKTCTKFIISIPII